MPFFARSALVLLLAIGALSVFAHNLHAETAVATCARCDATPCTAYCAQEPCPPCTGEEGDTFIFYGGNSTGTGLTYKWDFDGDTVTDASGSNPIITWRFTRPHNPANHPDGWPVSLIVQGDGGQAADSLNVSVANIAPTAVAYALDVASQPQFEHVVIYVSRNTQFHGESSSDHAFISGTGISAWAWDFDYDGITFTADSANQVATRNWTTPGTHQVRLRVTDDDSPALIAYADLTVDVIPDGPFARIETQAEPFTEGQNVRLDGNSTGTAQAVVDWSWDLSYDGVTFHEQANGQTVYHVFADAVPHLVALRVTDQYNTAYIATLAVEPLNLAPLAAMTLRLPNNQELEPPYEIDEGVEITFDGSPSSLVPPDTGTLESFEWDFNYDGATFSASAEGEQVVNRFDLDSDELDPPGSPYVVRLRVTDDDNGPDRVSESFATVDVFVRDVPPQAQILRCTNNTFANCAVPGDPLTLTQIETAYFAVADVSHNRDAIVSIEWDTDYSGAFEADSSLEGLQEVALEWVAISTPTLAARITDDDGDSSLATLALNIIDLPPTAGIEPSGTDGLLELDEGSDVTFSASGTRVVPGDQLALLVWDWQADPASFSPNTGGDHQNCAEGFCDLASWLPCEGDAYPDNTCPNGLGQIMRSYPNGPHDEWIVLCIEDSDSSSVCVNSADPSAPETARQFAKVHVQVNNVAPVIVDDDPDNPFPDTIQEGNTFAWCPTAYDPGADVIHFVCNPQALPVGMECNPGTGCVSWEPGSDAVSCEAGDNPQAIGLTVCDNNGGCSTFNGEITVLNTNNPPNIRSFTGADSTAGGESYSASVRASDPDEACGDYPSYYLCGDTVTGMVLDLSGDFSWTPENSDLGAFTIGFCARDQQGSEDCSICHWHTLTVGDADSLPRISAGEDKQAEPGRICLYGQTLANPGDAPLTFTWRQLYGPSELCLTPDPSGDPAAICAIGRAAGDYELVLEANNGTYRVQDRVMLTIEDLPPTACIGSARAWPLNTWVTLDGLCSGDVNGSRLEYAWTDELGLLNDLESAQPKFLALTETLQNSDFADFVLTVDDGAIQSEAVAATLELIALDDDGAVLSAAPFADITPKTAHVIVGNAAEFSAHASAARPGGGPLTYFWTLENGEQLTPFDNDPDRVKIIPTEPGVVRIYLEVRRGERKSRKVFAELFARSEAQPVLADAGPDQRLTLSSACPSDLRQFTELQLNGDDSQYGNESDIACQWTQSAGPPATLKPGVGCTATAALFAPGLYRFTLSLLSGDLTLDTDDMWAAVSSDDARITLVVDAPRWDAERRLVFVDPGEIVTLDVSQSSHSDNEELWFHWIQTDGPAVALDAWDAASITVVPDLPGAPIGLRVFATTLDGSASLPLDLTVVPLAQDNLPPVCVIADNSLSAVTGESVELDAGDSYDPNGDALTFLWRQRLDESSGEAQITEAQSSIATTQADAGGVYVFEAVVSDGIEQCVSEAVSVTVAENRAPVAEAGNDSLGCVGQRVTLDGSQSFDPDGHALAYQWSVEDDGGTGLSAEDFEPGAESEAPSFVPINSGTIIIGLVVSDGFPGGTSETDTLAVTIETVCEDGDLEEDLDNDTDVDGELDTDNTIGEPGEGCSCNSTADNPPLLWLGVFLMLVVWRRARLIKP
jgi:hypothetical protein